MALIKEHMATRLGATSGVNATPENIVLRVIAEDEDWVTDGNGNRLEPDPRYLVATQWSAALPGAAHEWSGTAGLCWAGSYSVLDRKAPGHWIVRVDFLRPSWNLPPSTGWLTSVRGASVTQHIYHELPPERKGEQRGGQSLEGPGETFWTRPAQPIGMPKYVPLKSPAPGVTPAGTTHYANSYGADGSVGRVFLRQIPDADDRSGTTVEFPAALVTGTRMAPNFSWTSVSGWAGYLKSLNRTRFFNAPPLHVKCNNVIVEQVNLEMAGARDIGIAYRIAVEFLWAAIPWGPFEKYSTIPDDTGYQTTVFDIERDEPVLIRKRDVRRMDFDHLLALLSSPR
jgi:hypothetical protein